MIVVEWLFNIYSITMRMYLGRDAFEYKYYNSFIPISNDQHQLSFLFFYSKYIILGYSARTNYALILESNDGLNWNIRSFSKMHYNDFTYGDNGIVTVGSNIYHEANSKFSYIDNISSIFIGNENNLIISSPISILSSCDSLTWREKWNIIYSINALNLVNGKYIAVGTNGNIFVLDTSGGIDIRYVGLSITLNNINYFNNKYIVFGESGTIRSSTDIITWDKETSNTTNTLFDSSHNETKIIAIGASGRIISSTNLTEWNIEISGVTRTLRSTINQSGKFIVVGDYGTIISSPDGSEWSNIPTGLTITLNKIKYLNGRYFIVGK